MFIEDLESDRDHGSDTSVKVKGKFAPVLCFLTDHHVLKVHWGNRCIAPRIHDFGTRWK
jgi:hypothetical protein